MSRKEFEQTTEYKCIKCLNVGEWLGEKLSLHADHIDGDRYNNSTSNFRWLCPNCHSQTPTYCGRNITNKHQKLVNLSHDKIVEIAKTCFSMSELMKKLLLNPNNAHTRNKLKEILKTHNITLQRNEPRPFELEIFEKLTSAGIDFSRYGWVTKAAPILDVEPQKVAGWLRKRFPAFYVDKCYTRRLTTK